MEAMKGENNGEIILLFPLAEPVTKGRAHNCLSCPQHKGKRRANNCLSCHSIKVRDELTIACLVHSKGEEKS